MAGNNLAYNSKDLPEIPDRELIEAELAERHFYDFVKASWRILEPTVKFTDSWHIGAMCEHVEAVHTGEIKNLLITVAPRMTKSAVGSIRFPAWVWGPRNDPAFTFMYVSFSRDLASDHSVKCRRLIESRWYQCHWGHRFKLTSDQNEKMKFQNDHAGVRSAFGMGGVAGQGASCVICDDPHDTKDWTSPARMKRAVDTYDSAVHNRVNVPNDPRRIVIMQRISGRDLAGHLLAQGNWENLMLTTEYDPKRSRVTSIGWKDPRKLPGELLCPARFGPEEVRIEKEKRPRIFNAQHQQNPSTDESAIFRRDKWRYYRDDPKEIAKRMEVAIMSVDAAFKDDAMSSMVAIHVWGRLGANKFLLERRTEHLDFNATVEAIRFTSKLWPQARAKVIEDKANGPAIIAFLKNEISGLIPWPPQGEKMDSKEGRAWAVQPEHEAGNLWLPDPKMVPWVEEFVEICAAFPEGEWDDDVDAMVQALQRLERTPSAASVPTGAGKGLGWLKGS